MRIAEAKAKVINRLGWFDDKTVAGFVLSAENQVSESGRFFQDEHSAVTLMNINASQPDKSITTDGFNAFLTRMKNSTVNHVLADVFDRQYISDKLFVEFPEALDNAISLRMVIVVSELINTSTRDNIQERFAQDFIAKLNYDIFREAQNKFAVSRSDYRYQMGISTRYGFEIANIQKRFGNMKMSLRSVTAGQHLNNYYD